MKLTIKNDIPIDRVARRVVFQNSDTYNPTVNSNTHIYCTKQPEIRNLNSLPFYVKNDPNFKDYTGFKFGRFKVIGMFFYHKFDKWVVKCCCGFYEVRSTTTLKKIKEITVVNGCCQSCQDLLRLKDKEEIKKIGVYEYHKKKLD